MSQENLANVLVVEDICAGYGGRDVIENCSLKVERGERVLLTGHNGAGKSTLVNCITGFVKSSKGSISWGGQVVRRRRSRAVDTGIVLVPQSGGVFGSLTVYDNLLLSARLAGNPRTGARKQVNETLDAFDMLARRRNQIASTLSGGERRLLAISRALLRRPQLLILDEPLFGLASGTAKMVLRVISDVTESAGNGLLMVEHQVIHLDGHFDRGYVMRQGRIVAAMSHDDVMRADDLWSLT